MGRRPSEGSKCLLLSDKIGRVRRLKSLDFQGDKVDVSREHPIAIDI